MEYMYTIIILLFLIYCDFYKSVLACPLASTKFLVQFL